ncbi:MAG: hypothetical protein QXU18_02950 [Thermoplasmatales archaeon]
MPIYSNEAYKFANVNEILAQKIASDDRAFLVTGILLKLFPILFSSIVTIYSIISTSIFIDLIPVYTLSIDLLFASIILFGIYLFIMLESNSSIMTELKIYKEVTKDDKSSNKYTLKTAYEPIYDVNLIRSIKKTINELWNTAFVILFPGGIVGIVLGIASNEPQIGINNTWQIILGIALTVVSIFMLWNNISVEKSNLKKSKSVETKKIKALIEEVQKRPIIDEVIRIIFDENGSYITSP